MSHLDDLTFDISSVAGNADPATKRIIAGPQIKRVFFANRQHIQGSTFGEAVFERMRITEVSVRAKEGEPEKMEGRVVIELTVEDDMLNGQGCMHGGCAAFLADIASTYAMQSLIVANTGSAMNTVVQSLNIIYHSPATKGDSLRLINTSLAVGARVQSARTEIWSKTRQRLVASSTQTNMVPPELPPKSKL